MELEDSKHEDAKPEDAKPGASALEAATHGVIKPEAAIPEEGYGQVDIKMGGEWAGGYKAPNH